MSNEVSKSYEEKLALIFSKKFFFQEPDQNKIIIYTMLALGMTLLGTYLGAWLLVSIFITFYLCYVLAAAGERVFLPASLGVLLTGYFIGGLYPAFWLGVHILLVIFFFIAIKNRISKIFIVLAINTFLFLATAVFLLVIIKLGLINYHPQLIQDALDAYILNVQKVGTMNSTDTAVFLQLMDVVKLYFPSMLFSYLFIYTLSLVQFVTKMLSREKAITPVYPRFSRVAVNKNIVYGYLIVSLLSVFLTSFFGLEKMSFEIIVLENLTAIMRWAVVFNGLFTCYFFIDVTMNGNRFYKIFLTVAAFIVSFIFEIIGILETIFKFRAYYLRSKGGR